MIDDRLATVLRAGARSEAGARTQYRQLVDLLGTMPPEATGTLVEAAYRRLEELADALPAAEQSQILRAPGLRLRNRALVAWLAQGEPQAAAAAMAIARLTERDWLYLVPRLPITARGFLRHRRDLPLAVRQVLERLGVRDLVLPSGDATVETAPEPISAEAGIGALVRRIEAFQKARRESPPTPALPAAREVRSGGLDFTTDPAGVVTWADASVAPLVVGLTLGGPIAGLDAAGSAAMRRHLPIEGARLAFDGPPPLAGEWQVDAGPVFDPATGGFRGYAGRWRRVPSPAPAGGAESPGDRMRQTLHELRTPVNAIQGFAEIIQQQLFGPAPHEYRALAAGIAVDAARLMAGFDELDRLARLESGALDLVEGTCDLREVTGQLLRRLEGVLRPRSARMILAAGSAEARVAIEAGEASALGWRLLGTLASAIAPGEVVEIHLTGDDGRVTLRCELPAAFVAENDIFAAALPAQPRAVSAGMFGAGFALRLARAEARAAGGDLARDGDALRLELPALTAPDRLHTVEGQG